MGYRSDLVCRWRYRSEDLTMDLGLNEKIVLIVGASAGIGAATARLLVGEGAKVGLIARRAAELVSVARDLRRAGGGVLTFAGDAADGRLLERAVAETVGYFGALHRLVVVAHPLPQKSDSAPSSLREGDQGSGSG